MHELPKAEKLVYSIKEACAASSLGRTTVYAHIRAGRLQKVQIGGRSVIPVESLKALLSADVENPAATPDHKRGGADK